MILLWKKVENFSIKNCRSDLFSAMIKASPTLRTRVPEVIAAHAPIIGQNSSETGAGLNAGTVNFR